MKTLLVVIGALLVTGCVPHTAIIDGHAVPRSSFGYTDKRWYAFNHWDAYPRPLGPSDGVWTYGGRLAGTVCGVEISFFADYYGKHLNVDGYYRRASDPSAAQRPVRYFVYDDKKGRHIEGSNRVDLTITQESIDGELGLRMIHLRPIGNDIMYGTMEVFGFQTPFVMRGIQSLWTMSAEDQTAMLPLMLTCPTSARTPQGDSIFGVDLTGG